MMKDFFLSIKYQGLGQGMGMDSYDAGNEREGQPYLSDLPIVTARNG